MSITWVWAGVILTGVGALVAVLLRKVLRGGSMEGGRWEDEAGYQAIFENSPTVMLLVDPETGRIVDANGAACRYYGYTRAALKSLRITDLNTLPWETVQEGLTQAKNGQMAHFLFQHRLASGVVRSVEVFTGPVRFGGRDLLHSIVHDIHDRKLVEDALRASEETYRTLTERLGEGLVKLDREGRYQYCNRQFSGLLGYSPEEMMGRTPLDAAPEHEREALQRKMEERRAGKSDRYELQLRRKDGTTVDCLVTATPEYDGNGVFDGSLILLTDITERKRAEISLRQIQKSESLSLMASGIAHDFNNLFQSLQANLEMALAHHGDPDRTRTSLDRSLRIVAEAAALSRKMLDFSGRGFRRSVAVDLRDLLMRRQEQLESFARPGVKLQVEIEEGLPSVKGDPDQILQVITGLIANAGEALEASSGEIRLSVRSETLDDAALKQHHWIEPPPGRQVISVTVTDSGKGIPAHLLDQIFDPFFSTKAAGRGLGLPAALGITRNHQAGLQVQSSSSGSTFRICFQPVVMEEPRRSPGSGDSVVGHRKAILLVDDDVDLREVMAESLRDVLGYDVLVAVNGMEAVAVFREKADQISLILMDAVMPGLSGGQAFDAIKEMRPDAKAILCSGYGDEVGSEAIDRHGFLGFLKKPFSLKELGEAIERART